MISGTFPQMATISNGGKVANTVLCGVNSIVCPADIAFMKDSSCATPYPGWEVFVYSPITGQMSAMVQIPALSNVLGERIYACIGNPAVTSFQGGARGSAYDNGYLLALHMEETSGTVLHDSTANGNDAVKKASLSPAPTMTGQAGAAQNFVGTANSANNDYALFGSPTAPTTTYTIEYWTKASSYINEDSVFLENSSGAPDVFTGFFWYPSGTVWYRNTYGPGGATAPGLASAGIFHYIVFVRNGGTQSLYIDGVAGVPGAGFGGPEQWKGLGWDGGASSQMDSFNGVLDEVFYSNTARSADYITARFNNLKSPSTFYSVSPYTTSVPAARSVTRANSQVNLFF
jgi:hypothetical protein